MKILHSILLPICDVRVANYLTTSNCISSLINVLENDNKIECIIVNDASAYKKTVKMLLKLKHERLHIIHNPAREGLVNSLNIASMYSKGNFLSYCHSDLIDDLSGFHKIYEYFNNNIGLVVSKLMDVNGNLIHAGGFLSKDLIPAWFSKDVSYDIEVHWGDVWTISRILWDQIGGLDIRYGIAYFEGIDLALEVMVRKKKVKLLNGSCFLHAGSQTFKTFYTRPERETMLINNLKVLQSKWLKQKSYYFNELRPISSEWIDYLNILKIDNKPLALKSDFIWRQNSDNKVSE